MPQLSKEIGSRIRDLRKSQNFSIEEIADMLHISYSTYQRIEMGTSRSWSGHIEDISRIFNVPKEQILIGQDKCLRASKDHQSEKLSVTQLSVKLIEQYEARIMEKELLIHSLKEEIESLKLKTNSSL